MAIRIKPDQAVPVLLDRLRKAKEYNGQRTRTDDADDADYLNSLNSKFEEIEAELIRMNKLFSRIKGWEKDVIEKFCELEQKLDDDVFKDPEMKTKVKDPEMKTKVQQLDDITSDVEELKKLIAKVHAEVARQLTMISTESTKQSTEVSKEWVGLGIEDKIFESEAMHNLFASFHCVESSQVKMCLLCLSIFPENSEIKKRPVIYWWIGEGLVAKNANKTADEVGEEVFQDLLNEGFIKPSKENHNTPSVNSFIVDPWIRRMLILAAKKHGFLTFSEQRTPSNGLRRAFLRPGNEYYGVNNGERVEDLLTVFNVDEQILKTRKEWLEKLQKVEVLHLGRWTSSPKYHIEVENQQLVDGFGSQKHLKYLSLRGISRIENLPRSIVKLISLKILDLRACHNLEKLPQGISALKNLTHLDVSECYLLENMPKGIENLLSLQVLKGFVIGRSGKSSCKISDLNRLKNLRKLSVRIGNEEAQQEDQLGSLGNLSDLRILTISWGVISSEPGQVSLRVSLPGSLRKLDLRCAPLRAVPEWMWPGKVENLEKLYITGGSLESLAHGDSQNWKVKCVRLKYLKKLLIDEADLASLFPEHMWLQKISCHEMD
ncbi:hypothetical protein CDL12_03637 [Handroanthus impetiginosus]|uniref:Disease resistance RPP13-like protein 4 n=1 Tax=Handroanthus impetiginosus TaxID=429701 RepID=A0A2G9I1M6_9LAMI|nr:hypothetical protein CDL12_03637 [Handroanthus impetiginosus]